VISRAWLIALTVALMIVSLPHALEDFHYGDLQRIGIPLPASVLALLLAYALQTTGITLTANGRRAGTWLLALMGAIWSVGAIVIHGHDLLFAGPEYRHGHVSKVLEALVILFGAAVTWVGLRVARNDSPIEVVSTRTGTPR